YVELPHFLGDETHQRLQCTVEEGRVAAQVPRAGRPVTRPLERCQRLRATERDLADRAERLAEVQVERRQASVVGAPCQRMAAPAADGVELENIRRRGFVGREHYASTCMTDVSIRLAGGYLERRAIGEWRHARRHGNRISPDDEWVHPDDMAHASHGTL